MTWSKTMEHGEEYQVSIGNQGQSGSSTESTVMKGGLCSLETNKMFTLGASQCFKTTFIV